MRAYVCAPLRITFRGLKTLTTKKFLGLFLSFAIVMPAPAATTTGLVKGQVSVGGQGVAGLAVTLVNVETGKSFPVLTVQDGSFQATVPAGSYVFSSPGRAGLSILRAPLSVDVASGKTASAMIEMAVLAVQAAAGSQGVGKITHETVGCIAHDKFTLIEATFEPLSSVVTGKLYFQSNKSPEWFYTMFELIQPRVAGGPTHRAFIPKVSKSGGITSINYLAEVTSADFATTKTEEKSARVVDGAGACEKMAPVGTPSGPVSVFSSTTGQAVGSIAGFGGFTGGLGATAAVIGGAIAGGGAFVANQLRDDATPTPTPTTTVPTPTPTPAPTATPTPQLCTLSLTTTPDAPGGNWGPSGSGPGSDPVLFSSQRRYCQVYVDVNGVPASGSPFSGVNSIQVACNARVTLTASAAPVTSKIGPLPASWSGACGTGSALGSACVFPQLGSNQTAGLQCTTR